MLEVYQWARNAWTPVHDLKLSQVRDVASDGHGLHDWSKIDLSMSSLDKGIFSPFVSVDDPVFSMR